jgi:hypothetical protein
VDQGTRRAARRPAAPLPLRHPAQPPRGRAARRRPRRNRRPQRPLHRRQARHPAHAAALHRHSAPAPESPAPGNWPGGRTQGNARSAQPRTSSHTRPPQTLSVARPSPQTLSVAVRAKPTAPTPLPPHGCRPLLSVDPATQRSTALQGDAPWDREETARIAENSQLAGRFRRWWQVLGSNQRRLSRRFYRPPAFPAGRWH